MLETRGLNNPGNDLTAAQHAVDSGALTFSSDADAAAYGAKEWNDYVDGLSPDIKQALNDYTREDGAPTYKDINGALRSGTVDDSNLASHVDRIDQALAGHPVPENVVVTRGTGISHLAGSPDELVGSTVSDAGYTSSSLGGPTAGFDQMPAVLHIQVPAGTPALYLEKVSEFGGSERELLLGRGSTYQIDQAIRDPSGQWQIYGHMLPPGNG